LRGVRVRNDLVAEIFLPSTPTAVATTV